MLDIPTEDLSLDELAHRIHDLEQEFRGAMANALAIALDIGDVLIEAQNRIPQGQWVRWLNQNCQTFGFSTAKLYIQLARHRVEIEAEIWHVGYLSLRGAREFIAKSRAETASAKSSKSDPAETKISMEKITLILRKALSLAKSAAIPGASASAVEGDKNEAIASLQHLVVLLVKGGIDLNDISVVAKKKAKAQHRAAA
jgi:hypothetical protein